ncbi:MAG: M6 family metalloprotease domain-containing protein [Chlorobi bacterium]|nr:M6 family metalloprotease domain-containing protein [Chlorobiota bacterium]
MQKNLLRTVLFVVILTQINFVNLLAQSLQAEPNNHRTKVRSTGVPAAPFLFDYQQPGGDKISIYIKGDGAVHWYQTQDGYTIMQDSKGVYYYTAKDKKGNLILTNIKVRNIKNRTPEESDFLKKTEKNLKYSEYQIKKMKDGYLPVSEKAAKAGSFPTVGVNRLLMILQDFPNAAFTFDRQDFDDMMNVDNYNGTGSFKDYYFANSYGQLTMVTTVVGWYTAGNDHDYYCDGCPNADPNNRYPQFVREAVDNAEAAGVDFSLYDNDNNGEVDGIMVLHQGDGAERGDNTNIWSHSWSLSATGRDVTYDGVLIDDYTLNPETAGAGIMGTIGVLCHEFGHNLGLPDFYDTDYDTNGQGFDLGKWDCMAAGSYNGNGATPAMHNAWSRSDLNWLNLTELTTPCSYTLNPIYDNKEAYYYTTTTNGEYFLLENRQQKGFDTGIPGHGMLIYHVDENYTVNGKNVWTINDINAYANHQAMDIEEADNVQDEANRAGDVFPGTDGITSFTDATTPNSKSWADANTNKPLTNITENNGTVTFDFSGGSADNPQDFTSSTISSSQIDLSWNLNAGGDPVLIAYSQDNNFGTPTDGQAYSSGDAIPGGGTVIYNGSGTSFNHTGLTDGTKYYYKAWSVTAGNNYSCGTETSGLTCFLPDITETFDTPLSNWNPQSATSFAWQKTTGSTPSSNTGPDSDHSGSGAYMYTEASAPAAQGDIAYLYSPPLDLSTTSSPAVKFYYHMYGADMGTLSLEIYDGGAWTQLWTLSGQQQTASSDPWVEVTLDISGYKNQYEQIRFKGVRGSDFTGDMAVDDVSIYEDASCVQPTVQASNLSFSSVTNNSITASWTSGNGDAELVLIKEGSAVNQDPSSGTIYNADNSAPFTGDELGTGNFVVYDGNAGTVTVTGLNEKTDYYFAVYTYNSADHCYNITELAGNTATLGPPSVTTTAVTGITDNSAAGGGNVTSDNGANVTERGICWNTAGNPTTADNKTSDGTGTGTFTSSITGLSASTTYYVRAYATNSYGTSYGNEETFTTACGTITAFPFTEGFENGVFPPDCWASYRGTNGIGTAQDWQNSSDAHSGSNSAYVRYENVTGGLAEDWLVTPMLQLGTSSEMTFWEKQSYSSDYGTNYYIKVSTGSQTDPADFVDVVSYDENDLGTSYAERTVDLSAYDNQNIYVAFVMIQDDGDNWYIDDINITTDQAPAAINWTGASDTDWQNTGNWDGGNIPALSDNVVIPSSLTNYPVIDDGISTIAVCNNLTIESGASVTINPDGYMTVNGSITNNAGTSGLVINSDDTGTGSLIQNTSGGVDATVYRKLSSAGRQWHMIASPIENAPLSTFSSTTYLKEYDETADDYWSGTDYDAASANPWVSPSGNLESGKGYIYNYFDETLTFTGKLNDNTSTGALNITYTDHGANAPNNSNYDNFDGWVLLGNPYTSAIDWNSSEVGYAAANLNNAIYVYDDNAHTYTTYVNGSGTNGGSQYIPAMQGFFVKATASGTLNIGSGARVHNSQAFIKNSGETPDNFIRLKVSKNGYNDETIVKFSEDASDNFDNEFDAYKMFTMDSNVPQIYTKYANGITFSINTLNTLEEEQKSVNLAVEQAEGDYTVSVTEFNFDDIKVYFKDNLNNTLNEIGLNDVINITSDESDKDGRFELVFEKSTSSNTDAARKATVSLFPNPNKGSFKLYVNNAPGKYMIQISDISGKVVRRYGYSNASSADINLNTAPGVYFIKINFENGSYTVKKIIVE